MEATRKQWGEPPWRQSVEGRGFATSPGDSATPDVAIVGGGLTGLSTALHLAKFGVRAVVFDAGSMADGASGRTGGLVLEGTAAGPLDQVSRCILTLEKLVNQERIDCDLGLPGCWVIEHRRIPSGDELPWSDDGKRISIKKTISGGVVQPLMLTLGIAEAAVRAGAVIREYALARNVQLSPHLAIEVEGQRISPGYLVIAANAWISSVIGLPIPLRSSLTFATITEPLERALMAEVRLDQGIPFYTSDTPYLWGRTTAEERVIFGSGLVFGTPSESEAADIRSGDSARVIESLHKRVRGLNPALAKVKFSSSWGGPIASTKDYIPLLGRHPESARAIVAGGYAGQGVALSVRVGELIALAITDGRALPEWGRLDR